MASPKLKIGSPLPNKTVPTKAKAKMPLLHAATTHAAAHLTKDRKERLYSSYYAFLVLDHVEDPQHPHQRIPVARNSKESPLLHFYTHGRIGPKLFFVGEKFRNLYELSSAALRGIDPTALVVDCRPTKDFTAEIVHAGQQLAKIRALPELGSLGYLLLAEILGKCQSIETLACRWSQDLVSWEGCRLKGRRAEGFISERFIEALNVLAVYFDHLKKSETSSPRSKAQSSKN